MLRRATASHSEPQLATASPAEGGPTGGLATPGLNLFWQILFWAKSILAKSGYIAIALRFTASV